MILSSLSLHLSIFNKKHAIFSIFMITSLIISSFLYSFYIPGFEFLPSLYFSFAVFLFHKELRYESSKSSHQQQHTRHVSANGAERNGTEQEAAKDYELNRII